jgi:zinc protease
LKLNPATNVASHCPKQVSKRRKVRAMFNGKLRMREWMAASVLAMTVSAPIAASTAQPQLPFEKYVLPNGLEVILSQDKSLPLVAVDLWYHVGAVNEVAGRTGFAHLFEHMMFTGSKHVPRGLADQLLEAAGATDSNASTSFDRTDYYDTVPSNQLELALWTHADRMGYLLDALDQKALTNQQDVVRNERRQHIENEPYGIVDEAIFHALFPVGHPYRPYIMGSHTDIQSARLADIREFFKLYYRPNNATLALVGDFEIDAAKRLVAKYFASLSRGPALPVATIVTPPITQERIAIVTDQIELERIDFSWLTPPKFKPDDAELNIAADILAGGKSSRLYKKLVYELQLAQDVSADQDAYALTSIFQVQASARRGHTAAELRPVIDAELARLADEGPTDAEVEQARNQIERDLFQGLQRVHGRADQLNSYNQYAGDPGYLPKDIERYARITPRDVQRAVQNYLRKDARVVVLAVRGEKKLDPDPPAPKIVAVKGTEAINRDEAWRNKPPKAAPSHAPELPAPQSFKLANGLTVLHYQRANLPLVTAQLIVNAGLAAGDPTLPGAADFAAEMLEEGTASRTSQQIADEFDHLGAAYGAQTRRDVTALRLDALSSNFADAMSLVADIAQHPTFPTEEIERQRKSRLNDIAEAREHADTLAEVAFTRALYGAGDAYGASGIGTEASVQRIGRADLVAYWKRSFRPDNAALVIVGDVDPATLRTLVQRQWGGWASAATATDDPPPAFKHEPTTARVVIIDKPGAPQTELRVGRIGTVRNSPDYAALQVLNDAVGGAYTSRINNRLREEKGYTYGATSHFEFGRAASPFIVRTAVRADVTGPAVKEILAQLKQVAAAPLRADEVKRARGSLMQSLPGMFETNGATAGSFGDLFVYDLPLDYYGLLPQELASVTSAQLTALAQRYLDPSSMIIVAVGDRMQIEKALAPLQLGPTVVWPVQGTLF